MCVHVRYVGIWCVYSVCNGVCSVCVICMYGMCIVYWGVQCYMYGMFIYSI